MWRVAAGWTPWARSTDCIPCLNLFDDLRCHRDQNAGLQPSCGQQVSPGAATSPALACYNIFGTIRAETTRPFAQCRSSAFAGARPVVAFTSAQPSSRRAQLEVRRRGREAQGRRCVAHCACAAAAAASSRRQHPRACAPAWTLVLLPRPQVYAAKGKQRMRTGGNTRMMQQMQQQMVRAHAPRATGSAVDIRLAPRARCFRIRGPLHACNAAQVVCRGCPPFNPRSRRWPAVPPGRRRPRPRWTPRMRSLSSSCAPRRWAARELSRQRCLGAGGSGVDGGAARLALLWHPRRCTPALLEGCPAKASPSAWPPLLRAAPPAAAAVGAAERGQGRRCCQHAGQGPGDRLHEGDDRQDAGQREASRRSGLPPARLYVQHRKCRASSGMRGQRARRRPQAPPHNR